MAIDDDLVLIPGYVEVLVAFDGVTTAPTATTVADHLDGTTLLADFESLGHFSFDEAIGFEEEDAQTEIKRTAQKRTFRETETTPATTAITITSLQPKDSQIMRMYHGGGTAAAGSFTKPTAAQRVKFELPTLLIWRDTVTDYLCLYEPKVSWRRNGSIAGPLDDFFQVPLKGTLLDGATPGVWFSPDFAAPVGP